MNYREKLNQKQGQLKQIEKNIAHYSNGLSVFQEQKLDLEEAQRVIQYVATTTQEQLKFHIENLVSLALASVFGEDAYEFEIGMEIRRGQTEADLYFVRNGEKVNPISASGGGAVDVASFALRVSLWSLQQKKTRPIFILDEPMKNISATYQEKASEMLKSVSDKLGLQIIMVTHNESLTDASDKIIKVGIKRGVSIIN